MRSTSTAEPSETRNWLDMPHEIMGGMILHRLGAVEILINAQKVCTTWRKICNDPAMWKVIDLHHSVDSLGHRLFDYDIQKLIKQAVHRSCGELIDISIDIRADCTDDLLDYISRCSSKLKCLRLGCCFVTASGLIDALKRLPHFEILELSDLLIFSYEIEALGRSCPQLKSFTLKREFSVCYVHVHVIANSMPALRHLQLDECTLVNDDGIRALLNGCPHLESLQLFRCCFLDVDKNLQKLCRERIKDVKTDGSRQYPPISSGDDYDCSIALC